MTIDLIFLTQNRREFTEASLEALKRNTNWARVGCLHLYDDESTDGAREVLKDCAANFKATRVEFHGAGRYGHPVNVMVDYLRNFWRHSIFGKIDSDTMVPPGWLDASLDVMHRSPELDLLGIEAMNGVSATVEPRGYTEARFIGGIGLMRRSAFGENLPEPNGQYFGFTEWQERSPMVRKGWLNPSLPVFLLDRFPFDPWRSLSETYIEKLWQRRWPPYNANSTDLWSWWWPR